MKFLMKEDDNHRNTFVNVNQMYVGQDKPCISKRMQPKIKQDDLNL